MALEAGGELRSASLEVQLLHLSAHAADDIFHLAFVIGEAVRQRRIPAPELRIRVGGVLQLLAGHFLAVDILQRILDPDSEAIPFVFLPLDGILQLNEALDRSLRLGLHQPQLVMAVSAGAPLACLSRAILVCNWPWLVS